MNAKAEYDVVIHGGTIYDGSGRPPLTGDVAIEGDTIVAVGVQDAGRGRIDIDARGLAVAPGFINMLSWAVESLIEDGRSQSEIRQGVTLEVLGEGRSWGPLNEAMVRDLVERQDHIRYDVPWRTLGEYLDYLVRRGVSPNVASFVGATSVRIHELDYEDRPPTPDELASMGGLVRQAMEEGAVGLSTALIYPPASFAATDELIALARIVAEYDGLYISHIRNEAHQLLEALDELLRIARTAGVRAEVYHLKVSGQDNWPKLDEAIAMIEAARAEGLAITADMYTYPASSTGLSATMPPWVEEGGRQAWLARLADPETRARILQQMVTPSDAWDNTFRAVGSPDNVLLVGFRNPVLKPLIGKMLSEVAASRCTPPAETILDLIVENGGDVGAVYFTMSEENVRRQVALPWVSFGSDGASQAAEGVFLEQSTHPRAYGNFARLLGRYVREEKVISLEEAVRRLTSLPARSLRLQRRGALRVGHYADVLAFDPATIQDHATFAQPHQYATGMAHVFVNGVQVLRDGEHTGATPGRVVRGPGWRG